MSAQSKAKPSRSIRRGTSISRKTPGGKAQYLAQPLKDSSQPLRPVVDFMDDVKPCPEGFLTVLIVAVCAHLFLVGVTAGESSVSSSWQRRNIPARKIPLGGDGQGF
ncbi:MAG: hypothetical protein CAPSK01_000849 [Candidatus Accumulibacter vicinus]|uniref:Uncharacterized protein n=1 Tax=Candidatus Accumulibacter vicinus TaxID=2954382 RepID=A0A084Y3T1_9PROT|nr:MAG: hypothetical protein CAPSK01_000849 [Candidatus Accumulibacter vicinus]